MSAARKDLVFHYEFEVCMAFRVRDFPSPTMSSPTKTRSSPIPLGSALGYTTAGTASVYSLTPGMAFSSGARCSSARAILRHQMTSDNQHLIVRRKGGLHPMYIDIHGNGTVSKQDDEIKKFLKDSCNDIFDAVRTFLYLLSSC